MTNYPQTVSYYKDGITVLDETGMNLPLRDRDSRIEYLKEQLDQVHLLTTRNVIENYPALDSVVKSRVVYFNGQKWGALTSLVMVGSIAQKFPMGISHNVRGITGARTCDVYLNGIVENIDASVIEDSVGIQLGVPYFLSPTSPGKITYKQPQSAIHIGTFLASSTFLLNIQSLLTSHLHRRSLIDSTKWVDYTPLSIMLPIEELGQLPLPFEGVVMVLDGKYTPVYGKYTVDVDGIRINDIGYFETLLGITPGTLYSTISIASYNTEVFWSDPRSLTAPGVMQLKSGTGNIIVENQIPGQPDTSGSLVVKNIPTLNDANLSMAGSSVVKDITVSLNGTLEIHRGEVVEKLTEGSNITISPSQGSPIISANAGKYEEKEMTDAFMQGTLSKQYPNTILTYIEHPYSRDSGTIYKYTFPSNLDINGKVSVFCTFFGVIIGGGEIPIELDYNVISSGEFVSEAPTNLSKTLISEDAGKLSKVLLCEVGTKYFRDISNALYFRIFRKRDVVYTNGLGIVSVTARYGVI